MGSFCLISFRVAFFVLVVEIGQEVKVKGVRQDPHGLQEPDDGTAIAVPPVRQGHDLLLRHQGAQLPNAVDQILVVPRLHVQGLFVQNEFVHAPPVRHGIAALFQLVQKDVQFLFRQGTAFKENLGDGIGLAARKGRYDWRFDGHGPIFLVEDQGPVQAAFRPVVFQLFPDFPEIPLDCPLRHAETVCHFLLADGLSRRQAGVDVQGPVHVRGLLLRKFYIQFHSII